MTTYEPGTVAVATVRGVEEVRVIRVHHTYYPWSGADGHRHAGHEVTDVRPLVVLDLDDPDAYGCSAVVHDPAKIVTALRDTNSVAAHAIARQIEAQTKPPRIPEPGLWGVVEAKHPVHGQRIEWMHGPVNTEGNDWHSVEGDWHRLWSDLIDPTLVRPGIEDAS